MLFAVRAPADNVRGPRFMQESFAAIHQANHARTPFTLIFGACSGCVGLFCDLPQQMVPLVSGVITGKYPNCQLERMDDGSILEPPSDNQSCKEVADLQLVPDLFPILRFSQFEDIACAGFADPIDALLKSVDPSSHSHGQIEITVKPTKRAWQRHARHAVETLNTSFFRRHQRMAEFYAIVMMHTWLWPVGNLLRWLAWVQRERNSTALVDTSSGRHHEREDDIQAAAGKVGGHLFDVNVRLIAYGHQRADARQRLSAMAGAFGSLTMSRLATFRPRRIRSGRRCRSFLLSHEELATLFHPPTASVGLSHLQETDCRVLELPSMLVDKSDRDGTIVGVATHRQTPHEVSISGLDRRRHLYVVGKTGMGKTTLLENQIVGDVQAGRGVCLIDPHGDLADRVLAAIPKHRTNDVVVFDPNDSEFVVSFNPLWCDDPERRDLVADDVLSALSKVYDLSQTPRLKDTLRNALYVLVEKKLTLLHLLMLLANDRCRRSIVASIDDDLARMFWQSEFPSWNATYRTEALSAVQNKVRPFLMNKKVRAIVGQTSRPLNLRRLMDERNVLVVNLSKGKLGEDNSSLLGALLVSSIQQAAMSRAEVREDQRQDFYLFVDEFQNFATDAFATILSEARKYRLNLTVAHQYLGQLTQKRSGKQDTALRDAVFGNVGSMISFQVGSDDAESIAQQLSKYPGQITSRDVANLPRYRAFAKLQVEGQTSGPFSIDSLPPPELLEDRHETVRDTSRRRYAQPIEIVQQRLRKELMLG